jgi:hypothetical protein
LSYKRKIVLINPKFQFRFSLIVSAIVLISSLAYPLAVYGIFEEIITHFPSLKKDSEALRTGLLTLLIIYQILYTVGIFIIFIFVGHKLAGPMYKLKMYLQNIADGQPPQELRFRKGDYFRDIENYYNNAFNSIKKRHEEDTQNLEEAISYINNLALAIPEDKKPVLQEIVKNLEETRNRFIAN